MTIGQIESLRVMGDKWESEPVKYQMIVNGFLHTLQNPFPMTEMMNAIIGVLQSDPAVLEAVNKIKGSSVEGGISMLEIDICHESEKDFA